MPATETDLLTLLDRLGIAYSYHAHRPVFTVEEGRDLHDSIPGRHAKNMFLRSKKGEMVLVTCAADRSIRIGDLEKEIGTKRLSFASPERLMEHLGVTPGSVTPFSVINDSAHAVRVVLDAQLMAEELFNCHPLHNAASLALAPEGLRRFLAETGHQPEEVDFDALEARALGTNAPSL